MSSEAINSTTAPTPASQEAVFTIDGKDYKKSDLNPKTFNSIVVRQDLHCLLYTSPSPRDRQKSRMPSSA